MKLTLSIAAYILVCGFLIALILLTYTPST